MISVSMVEKILHINDREKERVRKKNNKNINKVHNTKNKSVKSYAKITCVVTSTRVRF